MVFDEIVIGSGLTALGLVLGLAARQRILIIGGPPVGQFSFYNGTASSPCARVGFGGLGSYWHGVIPTGGHSYFGGTRGTFEQLFQHFYPRTPVVSRVGHPWLFVPWRPIRPEAHWDRLAAERGDCLEFRHETVERFNAGPSSVEVRTAKGTYRAKRLWVAAGALHTPGLLNRSLDTPVSRQVVSDHVICYLGQIDRAQADVAAPSVEHGREGIWFKGHYSEGCRALLTLRPARFAFSRLDHGIERRSAFSLPAAGALSKVLRGRSFGLFAEALYNRAGLFPNARMQSVYAQVLVPDAYRFGGGERALIAQHDVIQDYVDAVRSRPPFPAMTMSQRPDIYLPGTHLHHSVDTERLADLGVNTPTSNVQVLDASVLQGIGPEHHSFKLMTAAFHQAQTLTGAGVEG